MLRLFEYIDLFGTQIDLRIANKSSYHSIISILFSFIFFFLVIAYCYIFGIELLIRKNPKTLQSISTSTHYEFFNYTQEKYFVAWRLEDVEGNEISHSSHIYPYVKYYNYHTQIFEFLPLTKCKDMNLTFPLPDDIEEYNCIPIQGREFGGSWDDNKISYISLAVYLCENGANFGENEYCATEEEITQLFKKQTPLYLALYYSKIQFVPDKDDSPAEKKYIKEFININPDLRRVDTIRIGKTIIGDDKNFLFEQPKNQTIWSTASFSTYYYLMTDTSTGVQSMLYCLNFYMDKDYTYYRRWYMKISEVLAIISTFIKITDVLFKEFHLFLLTLFSLII